MASDSKSKSKFLSLILRHKPEEIGLELDAEGWASIDQLITPANAKGSKITRDLVLEIVATSDKQRFAISADGTWIRANQGHSVATDFKLASSTPPDLLFHGTATRFAQSIQEKGLIAGFRQHVHLSSIETTALEVGRRRGKPLALTVNASAMNLDGLAFYLSDNGVWLTDSVPAKYISFPANFV
jgi:putative RNA 2'-phosphotransferase